MASPSERTRNNVKAGIFVSFAIVAAFAVIVTLGEGSRFFDRTDAYTVRFSVASGVKGLAKGSKVTVGGLEQGRVTGIEPEIESGEITGLLVHIELPHGLTLYTNAVALRISALLGDAAAINFPNIGGPPDGTPLAPGATLDATDAPGLLATLVGQENAGRAGNIVKNVDEMVESVRADYDTSVAPALQRFDAITADVQAVTQSVRSDYPGWSERVTALLDKANAIPDQIEATLSDARGFIGSARSTVDDNRGKIDEIVENVRVASGDAKGAAEDIRAMTERARAELLDKVDALLARGNEGLEAFRRVAQRVDDLVVAQAPVVEDMLADASLTAQQLKLASTEIRRSPWKLLYSPSQQELEHELLYDAARSFAVAAAELKVSSQSLDRILTEQPDALGRDPAMAERLRSSLKRSLDRYEQAQTALFNVILAEPDER